VRGGRGVAAVSHGTVSSNAGREAGSGTFLTRVKIAGEHPRGGGMMRRRENDVVPIPCG
jgi:hypothetical protein